MRLPVAFIALLFAASASAEITLTLKQSFVHSYKDRATIEADCTVDYTKGKANAASKDGDMHIAVRCGSIALPLVAELMNAKDRKEVIAKTVEDENSQAKVRIAGAWRIWNEHA